MRERGRERERERERETKKKQRERERETEGESYRERKKKSCWKYLQSNHADGAGVLVVAHCWGSAPVAGIGSFILSTHGDMGRLFVVFVFCFPFLHAVQS